MSLSLTDKELGAQLGKRWADAEWRLCECQAEQETLEMEIVDLLDRVDALREKSDQAWSDFRQVVMDLQIARDERRRMLELET